MAPVSRLMSTIGYDATNFSYDASLSIMNFLSFIFLWSCLPFIGTGLVKASIWGQFIYSISSTRQHDQWPFMPPFLYCLYMQPPPQLPHLHFLSEHLRDVFSFLEVKLVISASPSFHTMLVKEEKWISDVFCSSMFWWLESSNRNIAKFHHFVKYSTCIPTLYGVRGGTKCRFLNLKLNISFKTLHLCF